MDTSFLRSKRNHIVAMHLQNEVRLGSYGALERLSHGWVSCHPRNVCSHLHGTVSKPDRGNITR